MLLSGELYKRPKHPEAKEIYQPWLTRNQLGIDFEETQNFDPVFDGSFVPLMLERFAKLAPFYHFLC